MDMHSYKSVLIIEPGKGSKKTSIVWNKAVTPNDAEYVECNSYDEGVLHLKQNNFDIVVLDLDLEGLLAVQAVQFLTEEYPTAAIVLSAGISKLNEIREACLIGAQERLLKEHLNPEILSYTLDCAYQKKQREIEHRRLTSIYTRSGVVAVLWDNSKDASILDITDNIKGLLGYHREDIINTGYVDLIHPSDVDRVIEAAIRYAATVNSNYFIHEPYRIKNAQGNYIWVEADATPVRNQDGTISGFEGTIKDVSERVVIEHERLLLMQAIDQSASSVVMTDLHGNITYVNHTFEKVTGYSIEEVIGKNPSVLKSGIHDQEFYEDMWALLVQGKTWQGELTNRRKNGEIYWEKATLDAVRDESGAITGYLEIKDDITERKTKELEIAKSEEKYRFLLESLPHVLWTADAEGKIIYINQRGLIVFGSDFETLAGDSWLDIIHPEEQNELTDKWMNSLTSHEPFVNDQRMKVASGDYHWFHVEATPKLDKGKVSQWIGLYTDINNEKLCSEQLKRNRAQIDSLIDASEAVLYVFDIERGGIFFAGQPEKIFGYTKEEMLADSYIWNNAVIEEDKEIVRGAIELFKSQGSFDLSYRIKSRDGQVKWLKDSCTARDPLNPNLIRGIAFDITDEKKLLDQVTLSEQRLKSMMENANEGYILCDPIGRLVRINPQGCMILGIDKSSGKEIDQFNLFSSFSVDEDDREVIQETLAKNGSIKDFSLVVDKGDSIRLLNVNIHISNATQDNVLWDVHFADITDSRKWSILSSASNQLHESSIGKTYEEVIQEGIDLAEEITNSNLAFFHLVNDDQDTIRLTQWSSQTKAICAIPELVTHYPISQAGVWVDCVETKEPVVHNDYAAIDYAKGLPEGHAHLVRDLEVPIIENGKVVAIIGVGNKKSNYTSIDIAVLKSYGQLLWSILERKKSIAKLEQTNYFLSTAEQLGGIGAWTLDESTNEIWWSEGMKTLHGFKGDQLSMEEYSQRMEIKDQEKMLANQANLSEKEMLSHQYTFKRFDDDKQVILSSHSRKFDHPTKSSDFQLGIVMDQTEEQRIIKDLNEEKIKVNMAIDLAKIMIVEIDLVTEQIQLQQDFLTQSVGATPKNVKELFSFMEASSLRESEDMLKAIQSGENDHFSHVVRFKTRGGEPLIVRIFAKVFTESGDNWPRVIGVAMDVTESEMLSQKYLESTKRYESLIDNVPGIVYQCKNSPDYPMILISDACLEITGYDPEEFYENEGLYGSIVHRDDAEELWQQIQIAVEENHEFNLSYRIVTKSGEVKWLDERGKATKKRNGKTRLLEGVITDISEMVKHQEEILEVTLSTELRERSRISKELHDGLQQTLSSSYLHFESLAKKLKRSNDSNDELIGQIKKLLNQSVDEARGIAHRLLPKILEEHSLIYALDELVKDYEGQIEINFYYNKEDLPINKNIENALYRITQEALTNTVKYAKASKIDIQLICYATDLSLTIDDNGVGFDIQRLDLRKKGFGIRSMKNRADAVGGSCYFDSKNGGGTHIVVNITLREES